MDSIYLKIDNEKKYDYAVEAYIFVLKCLGEICRRRGGHVSGKNLVLYIKRRIIDVFGFFADAKMKEWNLSCTRDFGNIVYDLVDMDLGEVDENDTIEEFDDVFDFKEAFDWNKIFYDILDKN